MQRNFGHGARTGHSQHDQATLGLSLQRPRCQYSSCKDTMALAVNPGDSLQGVGGSSQEWLCEKLPAMPSKH